MGHKVMRDRYEYLRRKDIIPALVPVSPSTFARMVRRGEFPAPVRFSRRIRLWRADVVRAWLAAREAEAA
jgi:prophage regulatory protein